MHLLQALLVIVAVGTAHSQSVAGPSTRFWDCCKASCSWSGKADFSSPVTTCDINNQPLSNGGSAPSGCDNGGTAFTCSSQQPWAINNNLAYGFAAVTGSQSESETCCACYKLTFTSAPIAGKVMIVQATNIGFDVSSTQFDLAIPGGGVGAFPAGCTKEWNAPAGGWGQQFGGVSSQADCASLPSVLQAGCNFRFDWMQGADNPAITYERVLCPAELTSKTNCVRADDGGPASSPPTRGSSSVQSAQTSTKSPIQTAEKATQTLYGQCGGLQWTGPTICPSSASCKFQNDYYSQCLST